jgi:hypothetical protein
VDRRDRSVSSGFDRVEFDDDFDVELPRMGISEKARIRSQAANQLSSLEIHVKSASTLDPRP